MLLTNIITIDNKEYTVLRDDISDIPKLDALMIIKDDYVIWGKSFYPLIGDKIIIIYDWYNTIQSTRYPNLYIIIGNDDVYLYDESTNLLECSRYR